MKLVTYLSLFLSFFLSSCANKITSGNYIEETNLSKIQQGNLLKIQIMELVGPPSIIEYVNNEHGEKRWIYVGRKYERRAFFDPKIVNQEVVIIDFINPDLDNSKYKIEKIVNGQNVFAMEGYTTKDYVAKKSYFSQFFGNLGRFNKKSKDKKLR